MLRVGVHKVITKFEEMGMVARHSGSGESDVICQAISMLNISVNRFILLFRFIISFHIFCVTSFRFVLPFMLCTFLHLSLFRFRCIAVSSLFNANEMLTFLPYTVILTGNATINWTKEQ